MEVTPLTGGGCSSKKIGDVRISNSAEVFSLCECLPSQEISHPTVTPLQPGTKAVKSAADWRQYPSNGKIPLSIAVRK